jgi:cephalosporin hydroxylase
MGIQTDYKGFDCRHKRDNLLNIQKLIREYKPKWMVELGTHNGGFAAMLADTSWEWKGWVLTLDNARQKDIDRLEKSFINIWFEEIDVLIGPDKIIVDWLKRGELEKTKWRSFIYCDNGKKEKEIEIYAPYIPVGGILGVHDFGTEVDPEKTKEFLGPLGFEPLWLDVFEESRSRFWIKS